MGEVAEHSAQLRRPARLPTTDRARIVLVGAAALGALIARWGPESIWPLALLRYGPPYLSLVPLLVLLAHAAWHRAWRWTAVAAVSLVGGAAWLLPIGWGAPRAETGPTWTLVAWNVEKYDHGARAVATELRRQAADVLCLSEAGEYFWHTDAEHRPETLAAELAEYQVVAAGELRVLSRLPVVSSATHVLAHGEGSGRPLLEVVVATPAPVHVFCMHAPPSYALSRASGWQAWATERAQHAAEVTALVRAAPVAVLAGDFNCPEASHVWDALPLVDAWRQTGRGFGWTTGWLGQRLDRVFVTEGAQLRRLDVVRLSASDHDALRATFARQGPT